MYNIKRNYKAMSVISKQVELIEMSNKKYVFIKHFLNIDNVPDARLFTGNSFHSRGAAAPNVKLPIHFFVMSWCNVDIRHAFVVEQVLQDKTASNHWCIYKSLPTFWRRFDSQLTTILQLFQHWCDVVVFTGACYKPGCIVLYTLQPSCLW